ncbi:hypothetical protein KAR91_62885 [Candidatus Pacearchaeota archaeon]|nr:hypothetical protein [Candidatus Pacearchaeota archaeon]
MANKIIRFIFLSITLMLLSVSVYYSRTWHTFVKMPPWIAWGLSGAFVASATALFDLAIGRFLNKDWMSILVGSFFILVWLILTAYSMYSTLAGQFNKMLKSEVIVYTVSEQDNEILKLEEKLFRIQNPAEIDADSKKLLIGDIDSKTEILLDEKRNINNTLSGISGAEEAAKYRTAVRDANTRLAVIETELNNLSVEKRELLLPVEIPDTSGLENEIRELKLSRDNNLTDEEKLSRQDDIFDFLSGIFNTDPDNIQFIALAFPSILVDLISPIFSALFFYYRKEKTYSDGLKDAFAAVDIEIEKRLTV